MAARRSGLGKGLDSLIPNRDPVKEADKEQNITEEKPEAKPAKTSSAAKTTKSASAGSKAKTSKAVSTTKASSTAKSTTKATKPSGTTKASSTTKNTAKTSKSASTSSTVKVSKPDSTAKATSTTKSTAKTSKSMSNASSTTPESSDLMVKISLVEPDRSQPRKDFDDDALRELADSIKNFGIIQPLVVKKKGKFYQIIAGERRWRAAKLAGLKEVPVVVRDYGTRESVEVSIIENIQRQNLNPIEESQAYERLINEFNLTQEEVANRVSKSRVSITNSLRLLKLDERVRNLIIDGKLSSGHARTLITIEDKDKQVAIANYIVSKNLSVRETEKYVAKLRKPTQQDLPINKDKYQEIFYKEMEEKMKEVLGSKVSINQRSKKKGKIEIEYYSQSDLEVIYNTILSIRR